MAAAGVLGPGCFTELVWACSSNKRIDYAGYGNGSR